MKIDPILEVVTEYAIKYKNKIQKEIDNPNEVEVQLNEWIKKTLKYCDENPNMTPGELAQRFEEEREKRIDL